jgi:hypothetical protein
MTCMFILAIAKPDRCSYRTAIASRACRSTRSENAHTRHFYRLSATKVQVTMPSGCERPCLSVRSHGLSNVVLSPYSARVFCSLLEKISLDPLPENHYCAPQLFMQNGILAVNLCGSLLDNTQETGGLNDDKK